ncbi:MAG: hypothetical protein EOP09_14730 [Proteobacteria bacterium]|nr:MAG: hypothetical protein EOP09_14730 [Pseudomonadota bacterium]
MTADLDPGKKMIRRAAVRSITWALPLFLFSTAVSRLLPPSLPKEVLVRTWGESVLIRGRLELPRPGTEEIQTAWVLEGPLPKPKPGILVIRVKTIGNSFDTKKRWNFAPRVDAKGQWSSTFHLRIPSNQILAYRIQDEGAPDVPPAATLKVFTDPARAIDPYLRLMQFFIYPSLVFVIVGFAGFFYSRKPSL